jgi:hypothetical protein
MMPLSPLMRYRWTRVHPSVMLAFAGGGSLLESQAKILSVFPRTAIVVNARAFFVT